MRDSEVWGSNPYQVELWVHSPFVLEIPDGVVLCHDPEVVDLNPNLLSNLEACLSWACTNIKISLFYLLNHHIHYILY